MWEGYGPELPPKYSEKPNNQLFSEIHELAQTDIRRTLKRLVNLPGHEFTEIVNNQIELNHWTASHLIHNPNQMPNQVPRAQRISRSLYGLPWWLIEAQYRRLRFSGQKAKGKK